MSFDPKPSTWLGAGYTLSSHAISLNTSDAGSDVALPEVTDTEANATTGDIRKVSFGLLEALYQAWLAQTSANQPNQMRISRSSVENTSGQLVRNYTFQFYLAPTGVEVIAE